MVVFCIPMLHGKWGYYLFCRDGFFFVFTDGETKSIRLGNDG